MKNIVFPLVFFFFTSINFNAQSIEDDFADSKDSLEFKLNWMPNYKEALKKSKKEKKPVLIYFKGSDWCGPCIVLDKKLFKTEKFKLLSDENLVLLEVDIPMRLDLLSPQKLKSNKALQKKYRVESFPTLMMVNHRGKKIAEKSGYIMTEYYYPFFQSIISKY